MNAYIDDLVHPIARQMADRLAGRQRAELMAAYFEPISVLSLGRVLGIDGLGEDRLRNWFWRLHQGVINFEGNPEREQIGSACSREIDVALASVLTGSRLRVTTARSRISCTAACRTAAAGRATT